MKKNILLNTVFVSAAAAAATAGVAHAQAEGQSARTRDVITVTATKTEQSAQDIPVAVSALDTGDLQELRIDTFSDYLVQLPGVSAGGNGPGQRTIYIRGIASTTPSLSDRHGAPDHQQAGDRRVRGERQFRVLLDRWR